MTAPSGIDVHGIGVDEASRCKHWDTERDIVAFCFRCCGEWFACRACHDETSEHTADTWRPGELGQHAVLCGACGSTMRLDTYLACQHTCPYCSAAFNPGCEDHWDRYFRTHDYDGTKSCHDSA